MPLFDSLKERKKIRNQTNRRRFLFTASAGIGLYFAHRWWKFRAKPVLQRKTSYITNNREFFNIAINPAFRPDIDLSTYQLKIEGPDSYSRAFSYSELRSFPSKRIYRTLMCVGNPVGGKGIGNAEWTVTRLDSIISEAVKKAGRRQTDDLEVCFYSLDGFYSSVPFRIAMDPET
jgi:DMSO/TMAO reductase YedYZ molybdopterin-dependent catalytic subunit